MQEATECMTGMLPNFHDPMKPHRSLCLSKCRIGLYGKSRKMQEIYYKRGALSGGSSFSHVAWFSHLFDLIPCLKHFLSRQLQRRRHRSSPRAMSILRKSSAVSSNSGVSNDVHQPDALIDNLSRAFSKSIREAKPTSPTHSRQSSRRKVNQQIAVDNLQDTQLTIQRINCGPHAKARPPTRASHTSRLPRKAPTHK